MKRLLILSLCIFFATFSIFSQSGNDLRKKEYRYKRARASESATMALTYDIENKLLQWQQKGEYEKTVQWEERLRTQSEAVFIAICKSYKFLCDFKLTKKSYDADNELLTVSIKQNIHIEPEYDSEYGELSLFACGDDRSTSYGIIYDMTPAIAENLELPNWVDWRSNGYRGTGDDNPSNGKILKKSYLVNFNNEFAWANYIVKCADGQELNFGVAPFSEKLSDIIIDCDSMELNNRYLLHTRYNFTLNRLELQPEKQARIDSINNALCYARGNELKKTFNSIIDSINDILRSSPFNTENFLYNNYNIDSIYIESDSLYSVYVETFKNNANIGLHHMLDSLEQNIKTLFPDKYTAIYLSIHPEVESEIANSYQEYRCNLTIEEYKHKIIYSEQLPSPSCRQLYFNRYKHLFSDEQEFDVFYYLGDSILNVVVEDRNMHLVVNNWKTRLSDETSSYNLMGACESKNTDIKNLLSSLCALKSNKYYQEAIKALIQNNLKMQKEYSSSGCLFQSVEDFFNAYISQKYKSEKTMRKKQQH